jgi:hypothetical protein
MKRVGGGDSEARFGRNGGREREREGVGRKWCRGAELNCLRRPFQGRALPVSYLGTGSIKDSTEKAAEWEGKTHGRQIAEIASAIEAFGTAHVRIAALEKAEDAVRVLGDTDANAFADSGGRLGG